MNNRVLGIIAMVCAPAMLVDELLRLGEENALITGIASMVFMAGWICSNIGMQRMRATGTGSWGQAVLRIQLVGLVLAFMFGFIEATGVLDENDIVFAVTDAAWPLSMLWMVVVGITTVMANRIHGWQRFVPLLCPFWLPIAMVGGQALGEAGGIIGVGYAAVLWGLLGYVVRRIGELRQASPTPDYAR
jgi:hypothetical protein